MAMSDFLLLEQALGTYGSLPASEHGPPPAKFSGLSSTLLNKIEGRPWGHVLFGWFPPYPVITVQSGPGRVEGMNSQALHSLAAS